jgi:hypothetical protein
MTLPVVVTVCGDPGGAGALAPVLEALVAEGRVRLRNFAYRQATDILAARNIPLTAIPAGADEKWIKAQLAESGARLLLTATSYRTEEHEKAFIAAARGQGLRSIAVLDFWANYGVRFADGSGELRYLPDLITAMDQASCDGLIADGVPPERIVVAGHPGFDAIARQRAAFNAARRAALRTSLGTPDGGLQVLFASQPLRELYGADESSATFRGFHEHSVLDAVIESLEASAKLSGRAIQLVIRPHPREDAEPYLARRSASIGIVVSKDGDARECAMASDLVIGMTTMLLVEACYLGVPTVSLQPELQRPNMLPELPGLVIVRRQVDVAPALADALGRAMRPPVSKSVAEPAPAAPFVAGLVYSMLGLN